LEEMNDKEWVASGWLLIHPCEGNLPVLRTRIHRPQHVLCTRYGKLSAVLNEDSALSILLYLQFCLGSCVIVKIRSNKSNSFSL
jgi:hypothetical protein